jgi:hypothetical protein
MAKKTSRKLGLRKETLRSLTERQLDQVVGAGMSGIYCQAGNLSYTCGSVTDGCATIGGGGIVIREG